MVFETKARTEIFKIQNIDAGPHVFFSDILGTQDTNVKNPIVGSWFRIEKGPPATPPKYEYDEAGVVFEGSVTLQDENGREQSLHADDSFLIHRGSTITFSSSGYGVCFKCGSRLMAKM
ncbi:hypothetical protein PV11_06964 [Exophiala sideris]|uniref:(S)-ureidoglycine aminohydrolase cupin domain-containing protein n=1 Tax=Exophiala sideris TaxID=1016849 RepID=A0A0D1Y911_9EURO|nr:hypothetical protein PV11_06964 [Exophiala sideris]